MSKELEKAKRFLFLLQRRDKCWCHAPLDKYRVRRHTTLCERLVKFMEGYNP